MGNVLIISKAPQFADDNMVVVDQCKPQTPGWTLTLLKDGEGKIFFSGTYVLCRQVQIECSGLSEDEIQGVANRMQSSSMESTVSSDIFDPDAVESNSNSQATQFLTLEDMGINVSPTPEGTVILSKDEQERILSGRSALELPASETDDVLSIEVEDLGGVAFIKLCGNINKAHTEKLNTVLADLLLDDMPQVIIDMAHVTDLDISTIEILENNNNTAIEKNGLMYISGVEKKIRALFDAQGVSDKFLWRPTYKKALKAIRDS